MDDSLQVRSLLLPFYERLEALGEPDPEVLMLTLCGVASTVPASLFSSAWPTSGILYILVGAVSEGGTSVMPTDNSESRVVGGYWIIGAGYPI